MNESNALLDDKIVRLKAIDLVMAISVDNLDYKTLLEFQKSSDFKVRKLARKLFLLVYPAKKKMENRASKKIEKIKKFLNRKFVEFYKKKF